MIEHDKTFITANSEKDGTKRLLVARDTAPQSNTPPPDPPAPQTALAAAVDDLLQGGSPAKYDVDLLKSCLPDIQAAKQQSIDERDYIEADRLKRIENEITQAINLSSFADKCCVQIHDLVLKRRQAQENLKEVTARWNQALWELEEQLNQRRDQILNEHESELEEFETRATTAISNMGFRPSPETLAIRKKESVLVASECFIEAAKVKTEAERMERRQARRLRSRAIEDAIRGRTNLRGRQLKQMTALEQWGEERRKILMKASATEVAAAEKVLERYDRMLRTIEQRGVVPHTSPTDKVSRREACRTVRTIVRYFPKEEKRSAAIFRPVKNVRVKKRAESCMRPSEYV